MRQEERQAMCGYYTAYVGLYCQVWLLYCICGPILTGVAIILYCICGHILPCVAIILNILHTWAYNARCGYYTAYVGLYCQVWLIYCIMHMWVYTARCGYYTAYVGLY